MATPAVKIDEAYSPDLCPSLAPDTRRESGGEVIELFPKRKVSQDERDKLILAYREFAGRLARSFLRRWKAFMEPEELISVVDLALVESAQNFDPTRGTKFTTLLHYHLRGRLIRAIEARANDRIFYVGDFERATWHADGAKKKTTRSAKVPQTSHGPTEILFVKEQLLPDAQVYRKQLFSLETNALLRACKY